MDCSEPWCKRVEEVPFHQSGEIKYYSFNSLTSSKIYHAVFTRHGGISPAPWHSLNFGGSVGDDKSRVAHNREAALDVLNLKNNSVFDVYQVHSSVIIRTERPLETIENHIKADAIVTNTPGVTLLMRFADCVPILLFDPVKNAIGILHAGWIGTVNKLAKKTIQFMEENFDSNPQDILAAIGPSIGVDHYVIGNDVIEQVKESFNESANSVLVTQSGNTYFDLWKANQMCLQEAGVDRIEIAGICTYCDNQDWYSHRCEHGKTGRFGALIGLTG